MQGYFLAEGFFALPNAVFIALCAYCARFCRICDGDLCQWEMFFFKAESPCAFLVLTHSVRAK